MKKGDKVKVIGLKTRKGKEWESLRREFYSDAIGRVLDPDDGELTDPLALVKFPDVEAPLSVPHELLKVL